MSKATLKSNLKAAQTAVQQEKWQDVLNLSAKILDVDPSNYYGNVFRGLALMRTGEVNDGIESYRRASKINPLDPTAWQGLCNLFLETGRVGEYIDAVGELIQALVNKGDRDKTYSAINKILPFVEARGTRSEVRKAYSLFLPDNPTYQFLEGIVPPPEKTYLKLAEIVEQEEKEQINTLIAARKSRLGATERSVTAEVKKEIWEKSPLQDIYAKIIVWGNDDQVRRDIEAKQLKFGYDYLGVIGQAEKRAQRQKVLDWAEGIVILRVPYELAWSLKIEWQDLDSIGQYDATLLRTYVDLFPNSGLATALRAYLGSEISPFPPVELSEEEDDEGGVSLIQEIGPDDRLDHIIDGVERSKTSVLASRILGEYYLLLSEYENAVDTCRDGQKRLANQSRLTGLIFQKTADALNVSLATALIHYQAPRHHKEASEIFREVLTRNPENTGALIGLGLLLEEEGEFSKAGDFLRQALQSNPNNLKVVAEAAWCEVQQGHYDLGIGELKTCLDEVTGADPQSRDLRAQVWWRIGSALWDSQPENRGDREKPYFHFMQALQNNPNFPPAFTSLGIYYEEIAKDLDRANKCFQKAFELSSGEYDAAERLARNFADSRDWELVEIVARRAADADKKRTVIGKAASWPQVAIGVVELNNLNFPQAIQAFQTALRTSPNDVHSWIGLGEAYTNSGRYIAATKAFNQAKTLAPENWFVTYMMSNVQAELGQYDEACEGYREVLLRKPDEFGVLIALAETLVAFAFHNLNSGFYGRAADTSKEALQVAVKIRKINPTAFNLWKLVGDACSVFSWIQGFLEVFPAEDVAELLSKGGDASEYGLLSEVDQLSSAIDSFDELPALENSLLGSILAYKRALQSVANDKYAHSVAWYNLGSAEYRSFICLPEHESRYRKAATVCFRRAIKAEPGNNEFWNALGVATADINAYASEKAFIRALHINEKDARVWTNLGTLYLLQEDYELANQAFTRAQSADPEYSHAWAGQGLVALATGEERDAQELFEHAFQISATESNSKLIKSSYATTTFDKILAEHVTASSLSSLLGPIFAASKFNQQQTNDPVGIRLSALYQERVGDFEGATNLLLKVCDIVESKYEISESTEDLMMYAQAKADIARTYLGLKDFESAIENATMALDLSEELDLKKCRLSAHLTAGLAYYFSKQIDESLEMFKVALTESDENPDVVALLAQVLWAKGGEDEREIAMQQLLGSIEKHPDHLLSTLLLGAIGTLEKDEAVMGSVVEDLEATLGDSSKSQEDILKANRLLLAIRKSLGQNTTKACTSAIILNPASSSAWRILAEHVEEQFPAEMALSLATSKILPDLEELCSAYRISGTLDHDQMSIFLAPWKKEGWEKLADDVQCISGVKPDFTSPSV